LRWIYATCEFRVPKGRKGRKMGRVCQLGVWESIVRFPSAVCGRTLAKWVLVHFELEKSM